MEKFKITYNHQEIKSWVEERNGIPAKVDGVELKDPGVGLRILFTNNSANTVKISWDEFFDKFENKLLALELEEKNNGGLGTGYKFVGRNL